MLRHCAGIALLYGFYYVERGSAWLMYALEIDLHVFLLGWLEG